MQVESNVGDLKLVTIIEYWRQNFDLDDQYESYYMTYTNTNIL